MTVDACADLVARGDPDRFRAAMAAPPDVRAVLLPLYAFNLEVSRAPWVTEEPMIAEMRLQFWRDVAGEIGAGAPPRAHEVAIPLAEIVAPMDAPLLDGMAASRRWDIYRDAFEDAAAFEAYLDGTGANLAWLAARCLGADAQAETVVRDAAWAAALARFLVAVPGLEARGRIPLVDGRPEAVSALASQGMARLQRARRARAAVSRRAGYALYDGWQTEPLLRMAEADPASVAEGRLGLGAFAASLRLARLSLSGRW